MKNNIRTSVYVGICIDTKKHIYISVVKHNGFLILRVKLNSANVSQSILKWIQAYEKNKLTKIIGVSLVNFRSKVSENDIAYLSAMLWMREDALVFEYQIKAKTSIQSADLAAKKVTKEFSDKIIPKVKVDKNNKVIVHPLVRLADYERLVGLKKFKILVNLANRLEKENEIIAFFSATPKGGGVALMRHALIGLLKLLGVDAEWYVMHPDLKVFNITKKKFHNVLQGVTSERLTERDKELYNKWIIKNAATFTPVFKNCSTIIIDDPQPCGMIPYIKKVNPKAKIIYRSHIHIDTDLLKKASSVHAKTWKFLWSNIKLTNIFVSHPISKFVPYTVSKQKVRMLPATTDEFDGLNWPLNKQDTEFYFNIFNSYLKKTGQTDLNLKRPYIVQVARFDPAKGIPDVISAYRTFREMLEKNRYFKKDIPQLVLAGHGSIDDPEGVPIFIEILNSLEKEINKKYALDIKVARLPHSDQLLNAVLSESLFALQLSYREGFEVKVSEALAKGKPVIAYKSGGIVLQIEHGKTGHLVLTGETKQVAEYMYHLFINKKFYKKMSQNARKFVKKDFFTAQNAIRWMQLILEKNKNEGK